MSANNRSAGPRILSAETIALWLGLGLLILTLVTVWVAVVAGNALAGQSDQVPSRDPFEVFFGLLAGDVPWPVQSTVVAIVVALVATATVVLITRMVRPRRVGQQRVDDSARHMGAGKDIASLTRKSALSVAKRLGVASEQPGVPIGRTVRGNEPLYGSWEDMHLLIAGPRIGKSTSYVVPAILSAPGAVITTSNKRDVCDATRDVRARFGDVWVFDPQGIALEQATWWWNPLSYVTDEVKAAKLAEHFAASSREAGAKTDAYFEPAGRDLLAGLLLAAALDRRPITQVYTWLTRPTEYEPAEILRRHDYPLTSDQVEGVLLAPDKQRGGIYGTAQQMASVLTSRAVASWVTPQGAVDMRPQFDPHSFVRGDNTLYSLSKEGRGSAGPLVTALTVAVVEAAEEYAVQLGSGRLRKPLLGVLDEAANVCRWTELPNLYSHYGSRGIILQTVLQSWSQGVDVWGESGMKKLWSASNVKVYGGGVAETGFLEDVSKLVGEFDRESISASVGKGQRSVSSQMQRERIMSVADLGALPKGRAVVMASGARPTLVRTLPWMSSPQADAVRASINAHDPEARSTITEAFDELERIQEDNREEVSS